METESFRPDLKLYNRIDANLRELMIKHRVSERSLCLEIITDIEELINSHIRQRDILQKEAKRRIQAKQRLNFFPLKLQRWLQGY